MTVINLIVTSKLLLSVIEISLAPMQQNMNAIREDIASLYLVQKDGLDRVL